MSVKEILKRLFSKKSVLTIPNLLTLVRFALIPVILWLCCDQGEYRLAAGAVALSGLTDVADGIIARKCNMTSDLGKLIDPVADKLTQVTMMVCLLERYPWVWWLIGLFATKELLQAAYVCFSVKCTGQINSSSWYGKVSTASLYGVMVLLFLFPAIPEPVAQGLCIACGCVLVFALLAYIRLYLPGLRDSLAKQKVNKQHQRRTS